MNLQYFSVFMNLFKRFLFFFFGLAIGSVFVMFFFQRKGTEFCYLPNCRVLKDLRSKPLALADSLRDYSVEQLSPIFQQGDVDFSRSDTHSACRTYIIIGEDTQHTPLELTVESCAEKVTIMGIKHLK